MGYDGKFVSRMLARTLSAEGTRNGLRMGGFVPLWRWCKGRRICGLHC